MLGFGSFQLFLFIALKDFFQVALKDDKHLLGQTVKLSTSPTHSGVHQDEDSWLPEPGSEVRCTYALLTNVRSRLLEIDQVLFLHFYGPRLSRAP